jgi:hypothetical protein
MTIASPALLLKRCVVDVEFLCQNNIPTSHALSSVHGTVCAHCACFWNVPKTAKMTLRCVEQSVPQQSLKREDQIITILILHEVEADSLAI